MDILYYLFLYFILNSDTMKKGQYPDPETVETTTTTISTETDSVPPADKPRPPKNSEETAG